MYWPWTCVRLAVPADDWEMNYEITWIEEWEKDLLYYTFQDEGGTQCSVIAEHVRIPAKKKVATTVPTAAKKGSDVPSAAKNHDSSSDESDSSGSDSEGMFDCESLIPRVQCWWYSESLLVNEWSARMVPRWGCQMRFSRCQSLLSRRKWVAMARPTKVGRRIHVRHVIYILNV